VTKQGHHITRSFSNDIAVGLTSLVYPTANRVVDQLLSNGIYIYSESPRRIYSGRVSLVEVLREEVGAGEGQGVYLVSDEAPPVAEDEGGEVDGVDLRAAPGGEAHRAPPQDLGSRGFIFAEQIRSNFPNKSETMPISGYI
jgi:hypothetical protein